ncbi:DNA primase [Anoxybacillus sp. BCO1]|nr:DNA primase [Anoxybacillus sp. BCO1]
MMIYGKKQVEQKQERRETVVVPVKAKLLPAFQKAERMLIAHMLRDKAIAFAVQEAIEGAFNVEEHRAIAAYLYAFYEEGHEPDVSSLLERIHDPQLKRIVTELSMIPINEDISSAELRDYIQCVLNYPKEQLLKQKEAQLRDAERQKDYERAKRIASEMIALRKSLHFGRRGING